MGFFMDSRWGMLVVVVVFIWYQRAIVDPTWDRVSNLVVEVAQLEVLLAASRQSGLVMATPCEECIIGITTSHVSRRPRDFFCELTRHFRRECLMLGGTALQDLLPHMGVGERTQPTKLYPNDISLVKIGNNI